MPFPHSDRVIYQRNPLIEVVCQLRFPTILRIETEVPAAFQERIREHFPEYRTSRPSLPAGINLPREISDAMFGAGVAHEFETADGTAKLSLTRDFIALAVTDYSEWRVFRELLMAPQVALSEIYSPAYFSRVGLRYRDQIDRSALGLEQVPWSELLRPEVAGELAHPDIATKVKRIVREVLLAIPDGSGSIRIVHGLEGESEDAKYVIDADFFTDQRTPTGSTDDVLKGFNKRAGNLFRWCIKPKLHDAMEPRIPT